MSRAFAPAFRAAPPVVSGPVLAAGIVVFTEIMFFAALISAYLVARAYAPIWPPPDQPRLPLAVTAVNTAVLLLSGGLLRRSFAAEAPRRLHLLALAAGLLFILIQGAEWARLLAHGLTLASGTFGNFFYLLVGAHALHAAAGLTVLAVLTPVRGARSAGPSRSGRQAAAIYWYFVVALWPILYILVYLA